MADLQISQLPQLAEADLAAVDELAVVDDSASETKRITAKALVEKGVALIDAGSIPGTALGTLASNAVTTASITNNAVTADKIAAGAVGASEIADGTITATEIAANTLTAGQIAANAIGASELADDAVDTAAILDAAVTNDKIANGTIAYAKLNLSNADIPGVKLADNSVTAQQIAVDAVGASELADNAVDTNAIANLAVTAGKLANNSVTVDKITDGVITGAKLVNDTITATQIAANAITASELADNAVDTNAILDDAVNAAKLAAGAVDTTALGAAAVTGAKIASETITAANIAAGTITATQLAADSVGNSEIAANAVGASELADDAVDTNAIANLAVTDAKIANATITYAKLNLADGSIPSSKLGSGAITGNQIAANAIGASELADNAVDTNAIADDAVTGAKIGAATVTGANIAATTIAAGNIVANTLTANEIAPNAIGSSELADNAVDTAAIVNAAVTNDKIANTTIAYAKLNLSNGDIAGAKIADNSITAGQIAEDAVGASELANDAVDTNALADDAVTGAKIAAATIEGANIVTGTITATQLAADAVGASEIAANAVGASELADNAVDTAAIANLAVTGAKIANATITANKLSLSAGDIDGTKITNDSITASQIAANAITASELADDAVDVGAIADNAVTSAAIAADAVGASELADDAVDTNAILDDAVTAAKLANNLPGSILATGAISSTQLAADSVTASEIAANAVGATELANDAVDSGAIVNAAVIEAKIADGAVTNAKVASGISGAKLTDGTVTAAKLLTSDIDRSLNVASGKLGINNTISAGTSAGISYNAQGLITAATALVASDLPVATATAVGGVSVPTAGGLTVTGAGALSIAATTTGATATKVTFNNFGQITGTGTLGASDLPVATASAIGAVSVPTGGPLSVDSNGAITVADSGVTAGVGTKVTVDAKGRVTNLTTLSDSDLPGHSAALITSGSIAAARIGVDTIDGTKLANASTTQFGSVAQTGFPTSQFTGQFFFDSVSEDLYIYDGNAYQPVTTLTKGSLVFGGTFNAATSAVAAVTTAGAAAGLTVGSNVPTPTSSTDGIYLVVENAGTPSAPAPVVALAPPDYILGVTNTSGSSWEEIDLSQTVAGQVASNITFTPFGQLQSTNVQDALEEVETEKLAKAGGTVTGQVLFGNTATLVFEGSSTDAYQTTLGVVNPTTADKTILLPNTSGTLITTNDSGTVTSAMIADDSIVNGDIKSDAAIAFTKLAALTSAQILVGNASNKAAAVAVTGDIAISNAGVVGISSGVIVDSDISGSAAITGSKIATGTTSAVGVLQLTDAADSTSTTTAATPAAVKIAKDAADAAATTANAALPKAGGTMTGNLILDNASELRLTEADSDGANYTALKAQAQSGDITLTLPATAPTANQVLKANASTPTTLEWATDTTNTAAADITGTTLASNVVASSLTSVGTLTSLTVSGTITGDVTGDLTGNADTATILATARTIGGVSFNGSANIDLPGVNAAGNQNTTGNAATATKFASAVTIGGVSFDGSANIDLAGVNTAGTQDTSGTAALATQFTVTANDTTNETVYPIFVDAATGSQGAETDSALTYNPSTGALTTTTFIGAVTGNVTGNVSGTSGGFTAGDASNLNSGTVATARLGSGTASSSNFLRGDNTWQTIDLTALSASNLTSGTVPDARFPATLPAASGVNLTALNASNLGSGTVATARLGSGTASNSTFLRGDGSWQTVDTSAAGSDTQVQFNNSGAFAGSSSLTFNSGTGALTATSFVGALTGNVTGNASGSSGSCTGNAATASLATEFTVTANNSTDETVYPLFVDGATGSQGAETDTGLSYNPSSGLLTSTSFAGNLTGNVTGNASGSSGSCTGNAATATALATARTINAVSFDGTANILVPKLVPSSGQAGTAIEIIDSGSNAHVTIDLDGSEKFRFTSDGEFLIGTTVSTVAAAVADQFVINGSGNCGMTIRSGTTHDGHIFFADADENIAGGISFNHDGDYFYFRTESGGSSDERFRISSTGAAVTGGLTVSGDLTVSGTTTTVNSTTVAVADKNIELGKVSSPSDTTADGGGLTLKGASDKTFNWVNSTDAWTSSEHIQVASGKTFIGDGSTLTALNASNIASGTIAAARVPTLNQNTTGNAASADTVDIAGEGTDATYYPAFVGAIGAGKNVYVNQNKFTCNPSTGLFAATTFSGSGASLTNVNATTLDSIDSGSFLRSDADDTMSNHLTFTDSDQYPVDINNTHDNKIVLRGSSNPVIRFRESNSDKAYLQWNASGYLVLKNEEDAATLLLRDDLSFSTDGSNFNSVLHNGNVGSGGSLSGTDVYLNNLYVSDWVRLTSASKGLYNSSNSNYLYAEDSNFWTVGYNGSSGGIKIRDGYAGTQRGVFYANDTNEIGILDNNGSWSLRSNRGANQCYLFDQHFYTDTNNSYDIGDSGTKWRNGYFGSQVHAATFHGDGSNLTNLPASGGTVTGTATGAINAGKAVCVKSNGTFEQVAVTETIKLGPEQGATDYQMHDSMPYDSWMDSAVDSNGYIVFVFRAEGGGHAYYKLGKANSSSTAEWYRTAYGNTYEPNNPTFTACHAGKTAGGNPCFILSAYRNNAGFTCGAQPQDSDTNFGTLGKDLNRGSLSGVVPTDNKYDFVFNDADDKFYACFSGYGTGYTTDRQYVRALSVADAGLGITGSTAVGGGASNTGGANVQACIDPSTYHIFTFVVKSNTVKMIPWSWTGSTYTEGTMVDVVSSVYSTGKNMKCVFDSVNNKIVVLYSHSDEDGRVIVGDVSGTTVTWGTGVEYLNQNVGGCTIAFDNNIGRVLIVARNEGNSSRPESYIGVTSGSGSSSTITVNSGNSVTINYDDTNYQATQYMTSAFDPTINRMWFGWAMDNNSDKGAISILEMGDKTTNATSENFIGFANDTVANGATSTVNIVGSTSTQSSLTPGQLHYLQMDGTVSTTPASSSSGLSGVIAGRALTSTSLLVSYT